MFLIIIGSYEVPIVNVPSWNYYLEFENFLSIISSRISLCVSVAVFAVRVFGAFANPSRDMVIETKDDYLVVGNISKSPNSGRVFKGHSLGVVS